MSLSQPYIPRMGERTPSFRRPRLSYKGQIRIWWREIDRVLLVLVLMVMAIGVAGVAAGSPASARRLSTSAVRLDDLHFYWLHLRWVFLGLVVMLSVSTVPREWVRRGGILLGAAMLAAVMLVPVIGFEVNGARRWIWLGVSLQPSAFLKPGFAIILAWMISWRARDPGLPVIALSAGLLGFVAVFLMLQPDLGSTILFAGVWFAVVMLAGLPMQRIGLLMAVAVAGMGMAYVFYDNARHRIDAFLGGGTAFDQVDLAARTLQAGGWTGTGFMLGTRKMSLPEAHTDYIFSVIGEEFGLLACGVIVILFLAIVLRVLVRLVEEEDLFSILAATGLVGLIGGQAFINILVNLQLFPSKGMTLPLVSYGGSSTVAMSLTLGLLLAVTRRNPYLSREKFDWRGALAKGVTV